MNFSVFPNMPESSKLLVFTSDITLDKISSKRFMSRLDKFLSTWSSHGSQLDTDSLLIANRVVFIAVDESRSSASGCSVDSLTNFIKSEGVASGVDWFNRHQVLYRSTINSDFTSDWLVNTLDNFISLINDGSLTESVQTLNTTVSVVREARKSIIQPFSHSWYSRLL
ncbi:MAG: hypothetical protein HOH96_02810 [Flavobacteriales bacterium]|jgi:hypothetical protein|nr:hypothetical protein [Flavobacteriales bacterium]